MQVDLHIHTRFSDGEITIFPDIASTFKGYGLISFTDHEHIFDPSSIIASDYVRFISGVEICCHHKESNIEILGYNFDATNDEIVTLVDRIKNLRICAIKKILQKNGFSSDSLPQNPFRINVALPDEVNRSEFWQYHNFEYKKICHSVSSDEVIKAIGAAGGVPVFAHPMESLVGKSAKEVEDFILSLNLNTIELITPKHRLTDYLLIKDIIDRNHLSASIGSDSHKLKLARIPYEYDLNERPFEWIRNNMSHY